MLILEAGGETPALPILILDTCPQAYIFPTGFTICSDWVTLLRLRAPKMMTITNSLMTLLLSRALKMIALLLLRAPKMMILLRPRAPKMAMIPNSLMQLLLLRAPKMMLITNSVMSLLHPRALKIMMVTNSLTSQLRLWAPNMVTISRVTSHFIVFVCWSDQFGGAPSRV